jgi:outer membrane receptor protein involved in Fe transport
MELGRGTAADPYYLAVNMRNVTLTPGGYIGSGPLANKTFVSNGVLGPFVHGQPGNGVNEIGGDGGYFGQAYSLFPGVQANPWLMATLTSNQGFGRFDFDVTNDIHFFVMSNISQSTNYSISQAQNFTATYAADNAFLPADARTALVNGGASNFSMSKALDNFVGAISNGYTQNINVMTGLNGTLWGFDWDMHFTHGQSTLHETSPHTLNYQRLYAALDSVVDPSTNSVVCRVSLTAAGAAAYPGCQPFNVFGPSAGSAAAFDWASDLLQYKTINTMDDFGASISGTIWDGWAGPIKAAFDAEYRNTSLQTHSAFSPTQKVDCTDQNAATCNPNQHTWNGAVAEMPRTSENVAEGAVEVDIPLLKDLPLVKLFDLNAAARFTQYSISGDATTWKLGGVWSLSDDFKLRGTVSRDIRAPTLSDLFAPLNANLSAFTDYLTGVSGNTTVARQGNPLLKPEVSRTDTVGFIYTPSWLDGLSVSADWYEISIHNVITSISGGSATSEQLCIASGGTSPYCALVVRPFPITNTTAANSPTLVLSEGLNSGVATTHGIDGEVDYAFDLGSIWSKLPGSVNTRLLVSYQPALFNIPAIPGSIVTNQAGAEGTNGTGSTASGRVTFDAGYVNGPLGINVEERWHSSERPNPNPTLIYLNPLNIPAALYTDLTISYTFTGDSGSQNGLRGFFSVENLFDRKPTLFIGPGRTGAEGFAYPASFDEDVIGRYFTIGLKYKM